MKTGRKGFSMRYRVVPVCLLYLLASVSVCAQQTGLGERRQLYIPPSDMVLLTIASQPDCPIQIENANVLLPVTGGGLSAQYLLRNRGTKPLGIQSVHLIMLTQQGVESGWEYRPKDGAAISVLPGTLVPPANLGLSPEIVPITDEIRKRLVASGQIPAVVVIMIEEIKFTDGTTYSAKLVTKALRTFFKATDCDQ